MAPYPFREQWNKRQKQRHLPENNNSYHNKKKTIAAYENCYTFGLNNNYP